MCSLTDDIRLARQRILCTMTFEFIAAVKMQLRVSFLELNLFLYN